MPVTRTRGVLSWLLLVRLLISTNICSKKSSAWTFENDSCAPFEVSWSFAWGVVMMGKSRRKDASTDWSKWSLYTVQLVSRSVRKSTWEYPTRDNERVKPDQSGAGHGGLLQGWFGVCLTRRVRDGHGHRHVENSAVSDIRHRMTLLGKRRGDYDLHQSWSGFQPILCWEIIISALAISWSRLHWHISTNKIVVAVPTKNRDAFSFLSEPRGCTLTSFASGRLSGNDLPDGRSRFGGCTWDGSIIKCLISMFILSCLVPVVVIVIVTAKNEKGDNERLWGVAWYSYTWRHNPDWIIDSGSG